MAADGWFKPKTLGYGAYPANWKGWAATAGYLVAALGLCFLLLVGPAMSRTGPTAGHLIVLFAALVLLTIGFIALSRAKTDGEWKWRWGDDKD